MNIVYVGSFDPPHKGHFDIMRRASLLGKLFIGIAETNNKKPFMNIDKRVELISQWIQREKLDIIIHAYRGTTIDFVKSVKGNVILRSLRNQADFQFEFPYAAMNKEYGYETIFLVSKPEYSHISSTLVRELISLGLDYEHLCF